MNGMVAKAVKLWLVATLLILPAQSFGAAVYSKDIVPSDGTTGQTLTTGSGVKTGHIQNEAVTAAKIANGAVTTAKVADGAVTDAKISGIISTGKLNVGTTAGTVAAGDHNHDGIYQKNYANVIVVAKSGGDYTDPSQAVQDILNSGSPSATNTYLVKIMPGTYDVGNRFVLIGDYIDIEGSGEGVTKITGTEQAVLYSSGSVGSTVRNLTVESHHPNYPRAVAVATPMTVTFEKVTMVAEGGTSPSAFYVGYGGSAIIKDSTIKAASGLYGNSGIQTNSFNGNVTLQLKRVKVVVDGGTGINLSNGGTYTVDDSVITVNGSGWMAYGLNINGGSLEITNSAIDVFGNQAFGLTTSVPVKIRGSRIKATATGTVPPATSINTDTGGTVYVGGSQLETPISGTGVVKCVASYNANWDLLNPTCNNW